MAKRRTGGKKTKQIIEALKTIGITNADVWYEPINGLPIEMQGYYGGWYYYDKDEDMEDCLGYNVEQALHMIELMKRNLKKMNKIDWQDYFLGLAFCVAERSSDSQTKHGTVLVDNKTNQILSVGYNGPPRGCKDDSKIPNTRPAKYPYYCHSECNSIFNCRLKSQDMTAYVTGQCCSNCLLSLWQFGVTTVVMADSHGSFLISEEDLQWEKDFVEHTGIVLKKVKPNLDWLISVVNGRAGEFIQEKNIHNSLLHKEYRTALNRNIIVLSEMSAWDRYWRGLRLAGMSDITTLFLEDKQNAIPPGYKKIYLAKDKDGPVLYATKY